MKKGLLFIGLAGLFLGSCSSNESTDVVEEKVEVVNYQLDKGASVLKWKGSASPEYFHSGTVSFEEGSMTTEDGAIKEGTFVIDMASIKVTDIEEDEKRASLERHLMGLDDNEHHKPEDFFHTTKFPKATVTIGEYKDGKLTTTLELVGKKVTNEVPVAVEMTEEGASITGAFQFDLTETGIPGLQPDEDGNAYGIEYELELHLTK